MKKITAITVALLSIGAISAITIGYGYFTTIHVISKEQAFSLAMQYGQWTPEKLGNDTIKAELLQAKISNNTAVALLLNDTTMSYGSHAVPLRTGYVKNDQLFWEVVIQKHLSETEYQQWIYEIDAINGTRIQSITPNG